MRCIRCYQDQSDLNELGWCNPCFQFAFTRLLPWRLEVWMIEAETRYRKSIFYSNEVPSEFATRTQIHRGLANGFTSQTKNFYLQKNVAPSRAIREFILGSLTVCECQGLFIAVLFNGICDILGDSLFDTLFFDLAIETSMMGGPMGIAAEITVASALNNDEGLVKYGDWIYIFNSATEQFQLGVARGEYDPAASGWNLLCVNEASPKKYMGLGLSETTGVAAAYTLEEIRTSMLTQPTEYKDLSPKHSKRQRRKSIATAELSSPTFSRNTIPPSAIMLKMRRYIEQKKFLAWVKTRRSASTELLLPCPRCHSLETSSRTNTQRRLLNKCMTCGWTF